MPLPRGDEYNQAVQNPRICFSDGVLKSCHVETNPLGLPKPYSGGFTTTYRLLNSGDSWAVRCFTRDISDLQKRYQAIGTFLSQNTCPILVEAKYLSNGIKVNGIYHPIIKMKWLDGETLNIYLGKVYHNKTILQNLLSDFISLNKTLETYGIAHGDLQHGNIIVKNNKQYLVDYDGMFFPELSTLHVNELGHPNFQHPKRTPSDYSKNIDRFSAIVIYTALKALTIAPSLWTKYDNGDNILFKGKDFADPQGSQLIKELIGYSELSKLANNLIAVCSWSFSQIPTLTDFISKTYTPPLIVAPSKVVVRSPYPVIDAFEKGRLAEYIGRKVVVVGQISVSRNGITKHGDPYLFLNFGVYPHQTLTIVLWKEALAEFRKNGINPSNFVNKFVSITGVLGSYLGKAQISVDYSNQIQILSGREESNQLLSNDRDYTLQKTSKTTSGVTTKTNDPYKKLNEIYKNIPVTSKPVVPSRPVSKPTYTSSSSSTSGRSTYTKSSSSKSSSNTGCIVLIVSIVLGGILIAAATGEPQTFVAGGFVGGIIGAIIIGIINRIKN